MDWHARFRYEPDTGELFWRVTNSNRAVAGSRAGTIDSDGYVGINTGGKIYKAHRIIWDMFNPSDPLMVDEQVDHINHKRDDNRLVNLRKVSALGNRRNTGPGTHNTSGVVGVGWRKDRNCWRAHITVNRKQIVLGCFDTFDDAVSARKEAEIRFGFHENHGLKHNEIKV